MAFSRWWLCLLGSSWLRTRCIGWRLQHDIRLVAIGVLYLLRRKFAAVCQKSRLQLPAQATLLTHDASGSNLAKLCHVMYRKAGVIICVEIVWGPAPPRFWSAERNDNLSRFRTTLEFDREYLRNGSRYRRADTSVVNYDPFHVRRKKWVNFGPLTRKFTRVMITHPKWTLRVLCRLMQLHSPCGVATSESLTP